MIVIASHRSAQTCGDRASPVWLEGVFFLLFVVYSLFFLCSPHRRASYYPYFSRASTTVLRFQFFVALFLSRKGAKGVVGER